jgi:predicted DsbA family dithiol-disulfide isomerase
VTRPLDITVISDVICPWCFIGSRRLAQVLDGLRDEVTPRIEDRPFLLDATVPPEGADLRDRLRKKYGIDPEAMFRQIEQVARDTGIPLDFSTVHRTPNTIPAHTLLRHAAARGTQLALSDALFTSYFLDGQDISDPEVLAALGQQHGFSADETRALVTSEAEADATRAEALSASRSGVNGVPFFIFGNKVAFSGAQPAHMFRGAIAKAVEEGG